MNTGREILINNVAERGILVVDDELDVINYVKVILNASGYFKIYEARDGVEALSVIERHKSEIYLVLLDLAMPRMDGMSFLKHLVNVQSIPIGIEIITGWGFSNKQSKEKFFSFIHSQTVIPFNISSKPFNASQLVKDVEIALEDIHKKRLLLTHDKFLLSTNSVFIIHGHDELNLMRLQGFLKNDLSLSTTILSQQDNAGRTLIEKFEEEAFGCKYVFALFSPDDAMNNEYYQARPNVVFELGWFYSAIGRKRVCILQQEKVKIHSDLDGIARIIYKDSILEKTNEIVRELKAAGVLPA